MKSYLANSTIGMLFQWPEVSEIALGTPTDVGTRYSEEAIPRLFPAFGYQYTMVESNVVLRFYF